MPKKLYVFTSQFPFATRESFLEEEVLYLCKKFEKVVFVPFYGDRKIRPLPSNATVYGPVANIKNKFSYYISAILPGRTFFTFIKDFFSNKVFADKGRFRMWLMIYLHVNCILRSEAMKLIRKELCDDDVFYFYWGRNENTLSLFIKNNCHFVSRFHGDWDLWEEPHKGYATLRPLLAKKLDCAIMISQKGENYFRNRYPYSKTAVFPLGTRDYGLQQPAPHDGTVRVVSCSSVYPLKRVSLIFDALNSINDLKIEWTHIGDGPDFELLKSKVNGEKKPHLMVNLLGRLPNKEVLDYYSKHHFDMFVNMSTSEGVPVSIMEAMSFGIPILATDVGSTSEEVQPQVGELLSPNPSINEITVAVHKILTAQYTPRNFWQDHFNAENNHTAFAEMLYNM